MFDIDEETFESIMCDILLMVVVSTTRICLEKSIVVSKVKATKVNFFIHINFPASCSESSISSSISIMYAILIKNKRRIESVYHFPL